MAEVRKVHFLHMKLCEAQLSGPDVGLGHDSRRAVKRRLNAHSCDIFNEIHQGL